MLSLDKIKSLGGFFKIAVRDFAHSGSVLPSSPFAVSTIVKHLGKDARSVVEYGPGMGNVTREILQRLPLGGRLMAVEVNESFATSLREIADSRLVVEHADVLRFSSSLRERFPQGVDAVVSGIPFSFLNRADRIELVDATFAGLKVGGRLVVYQNSPRLLPELERRFETVRSYFEPRNILPYFILVATRHR